MSPDPVWPGLFLPCSLPRLLSAAAGGGLEPSPVSRFRGASPHRLLSDAKESSVADSYAHGTRSRPGEFHPEPLTDPDLNLSIHPARAIRGELPPSRQNRGFLLSPVDPLRFPRRWPARFAPRTLLRFLATTRQSAPQHRIRTLALVVQSTCGFSVCIDAKVLMFHTTASSRFRPPVCRMPLRP